MQPLRWEPCRALAGALAGAVVHGRDPGPLGACPTPRFSAGYGRQGNAGVEPWLRYHTFSVNRGTYPVPLGVLVWMGFSGVPGPEAKPLPSF